ncbi:hypothetical protein FS837_012079 [Tulasnella sp. UAMH 9824]|nr:hypothetical protein FS837_012079 [Tulasnella sp. UAMH 9824]
MSEVLVKLWEDISHEKSDPRSRLGVASVSEDDSGDSEASDIDLIQGAPDQGRNSSLLTTNLAPPEDSFPSPPQPEEERNQ